MKLNPHGDAAIYETMVRLATGNEALLTPFVESKGNFGKYYSATWPTPPPVTPRPSSPPSAQRYSGTSTRTRWTSSTATTAP